MSGFKAACVAWDAEELPGWVTTRIEEAGVEFASRQCETSEQVVEMGADADVVWVMGGSKLITAEMLPSLARCGAIIRSGSGTDNIPVEAATAQGIMVCNTPGATAVPVAEHTIALLLSVNREIPAHDQLIRQGIWDPKRSQPRFLIRDNTVGLVGFGHIARCVAERLQPFGARRILACDPMVDPQEMAKRHVESVDMAELLAESDFISVHTPLLKETHHLIGEAEIAQMKKSCVLINTSRGPVVDTKALARALKEDRLAAAGLDVLESEPPAADDPLIGLPNVVITAHTAGYYDGHLNDFWRLSAETVIDLSHQKWPISCVNPGVEPRWELAPPS
jgi:D-3-phosphoglycerate dehydrogenase